MHESHIYIQYQWDLYERRIGAIFCTLNTTLISFVFFKISYGNVNKKKREESTTPSIIISQNL